MPTRHVVVQLVVAFGVLLQLCSPTDLSDDPFTGGLNSTADLTMDGNATGSPDIIHRQFGTRASTDGAIVSTVQIPVTRTVQASDGT